MSHPSRWAVILAYGQGGFYFLSGVWPLVHGESFQAVTGPKLEFWLAQTVGVLLAITGAVLMGAAYARRITPEIMFLAGAQAAALAVIDVYCVPLPRTTPAYLLDAVVEAALVIGWLQAWRLSRRPAETRT